MQKAIFLSERFQRRLSAMTLGPVFKEWQQRRQNMCAKLEVVGVAEMNCEDVEDLTVPLEHVAKYAKLSVEQVRL